eukprot:9482561-Pyramimonas_sp.AAC.1
MLDPALQDRILHLLSCGVAAVIIHFLLGEYVARSEATTIVCTQGASDVIRPPRMCPIEVVAS